MNGRVTLDITLTLDGPVLTQASSTSGYGVDASMAKSDDGRYYLPGTLIKGRLRQSWEELHTFLGITGQDLKKLLGSGSGNRNNDMKVEPDRGQMQFSDFFTSTGEEGNSHYRIRMDEARGAVDTGAYLVMEAPFVPGEEVLFQGTISFFAAEEDVPQIRRYIESGLKWNLSFGAERTVGFGRLKQVIVSESPATDATVFPTINDDHFTIALRPEAPFCLGERQYKENLFDSKKIIAGGVIKGAIASTWGMLLGKGANNDICRGFDSARPELSEWFDKVRITHAFPAVQGTGKRPVVFPHSLVKGVDGTLKDIAIETDAILVDGAAPAFSIDWKESGDVYKRFGWPHVKKELRVRTALDRTTRKAADKQLFAYEMVVPEGLEWLATVDLSRVKDGIKNDEEIRKLRVVVKSQLIDLLHHGIHGLSKTKTSASVTISANSLVTEPKTVNDYYIITLQTPALLIKPDALDETSGRDRLKKVYEDIWRELSNKTLELYNYFASQSLVGGYYLHKRFREGKDYYPWLLTDAGSVFVLKTTDKGDAVEVIRKWLQQGLQFPDWAILEYEREHEKVKLPGNHWKNCPFIPENGYGEIMLTRDLLDVPKEVK